MICHDLRYLAGYVPPPPLAPPPPLVPPVYYFLSHRRRRRTTIINMRHACSEGLGGRVSRNPGESLHGSTHRATFLFRHHPPGSASRVGLGLVGHTATRRADRAKRGRAPHATRTTRLRSPKSAMANAPPFGIRRCGSPAHGQERHARSERMSDCDASESKELYRPPHSTVVGRWPMGHVSIGVWRRS